jgi:hypothetical protein
VFFLRDKQISRMIIHTHTEFIDLFKKKLNWLELLKLSLDIFTGDLKGFSNISDNK